jgi:glutamate decarboxylase
MPLHRQVDPERAGEHVSSAPAEYLLAEMHAVPKHRMPQHGLPSGITYQLVHDELMLDGNAKLNLATFVTTSMNDEASRLMADTFDKNMIDKDEYPQTAELERRCVNIIACLWNACEGGEATGCSTTGSSEAAMLGGLALKWRWREKRRAAGKPVDKPNLVMGINVQVCWEKFCRYWDVEPRYAPLAPGRLHLTAEEAVKLCDENTIGVVAILGSTFDGSYEPVEDICEALDDLQAGGGPDVPVHVDGASGGFVAPFIQPNLVWDFRLPRVQSINASGHKFGLVYPGVGWVIWRDAAALPDDLVFKVNYLGGDMPTFALNFSRPGSQVCAQYFTFVHLGLEGYRRVQQGCQDVATYLSSNIERMGMFELLSEGRDLPVFAFKLKDDVANYTVFDVSRELRTRGWLVPAYTFPEDLTDMAALRIVIRNGFGHDMADMLLADLQRTVAFLEQLKEPLPSDEQGSFKH